MLFTVCNFDLIIYMVFTSELIPDYFNLHVYNVHQTFLCTNILDFISFYHKKVGLRVYAAGLINTVEKPTCIK